MVVAIVNMTLCSLQGNLCVWMCLGEMLVPTVPKVPWTAKMIGYLKSKHNPECWTRNKFANKKVECDQDQQYLWVDYKVVITTLP